MTPPSHQPKVSVLLPMFNGGHFLAECLDSIVTQDFPDMEILVADDGSTDDSCEIIKRYADADARIRYWKNPRTLGLTANANACLRAARGEYIKCMHQDDTLLCRSAIRKMVAALDQHPSAVLTASRQHVTGARTRPIILSDNNSLFDGRRIILASLESNSNLVGQPTLTLFRKSCSRRGFDERFTGHMDFELWLHLLEQGDFVYLAEPLATWRVHPHQQTSRMQKIGHDDHEHLMLLETYYSKPWLRQEATARLLFTQIHHLRKKYGRSAENLTREMLADLSARRYRWLWLQHKLFNPLRKLSSRLSRQNPASWPALATSLATVVPKSPGRRPAAFPATH